MVGAEENGSKQPFDLADAKRKLAQVGKKFLAASKSAVSVDQDEASQQRKMDAARAMFGKVDVLMNMREIPEEYIEGVYATAIHYLVAATDALNAGSQTDLDGAVYDCDVAVKSFNYLGEGDVNRREPRLSHQQQVERINKANKAFNKLVLTPAVDQAAKKKYEALKEQLLEHAGEANQRPQIQGYFDSFEQRRGDNISYERAIPYIENKIESMKVEIERVKQKRQQAEAGVLAANPQEAQSTQSGALPNIDEMRARAKSASAAQQASPGLLDLRGDQLEVKPQVQSSDQSHLLGGKNHGAEATESSVELINLADDKPTAEAQTETQAPESQTSQESANTGPVKPMTFQQMKEAAAANPQSGEFVKPTLPKFDEMKAKHAEGMRQRANSTPGRVEGTDNVNLLTAENIKARASLSAATPQQTSEVKLLNLSGNAPTAGAQVQARTKVSRPSARANPQAQPVSKEVRKKKEKNVSDGQASVPFFNAVGNVIQAFM